MGGLEKYANPHISGNHYQFDIYKDASPQIEEDLKSLGWYSRRYIDNNKFDKFARIQYNDPYNAINKTKEYVFFTKPDLNLVENGSLLKQITDPFIQYTFKTYPKVIEQLRCINGVLSPILSNRISEPLDIPSINLKEIETNKNRFGTSVEYTSHYFDSDENSTFTVEFIDDKYLTIYKIFRVWAAYSNLKSIGVIPTQEKYIKSREIYDQISIYKIITLWNGVDILYFGKYTGCGLRSINRDTFSSVDGTVNISVGFKSFCYRDMDPSILLELNNLVGESLSGGISAKKMPLTNRNGMFDGSWAAAPYFDVSGKKNGTCKLRWLLGSNKSRQ